MTIKRRKALPRPKRSIARKTRVKPVNAKRRKKNHARAYGGAERIEWMHGLACAVTAGRHYGPIEVAHTTTGGIGRKADSRHTIPLCHYHHGNLHGWGAKSFELAYGVSLAEQAELTEHAWQTYKGTQLEHLPHDGTNR